MVSRQGWSGEMAICVSWLHASKGLTPTEVALSGMETEVRLAQEEKA